MITYLYGTDTYRIKAYLREHAPDAMVGEDALKTKGLFDQAPVILYVSDEALAKSDELPNIPKDVEVFIVSEKKIKKGIEFKPLKDNEIRAWIQEELKKQGFAIAPDALTILANQYVDTWQTSLELTMLMNYAHDQKTITKDALTVLTPLTVEESIFKLTDAIANKYKGDAVALLERQLASGADPYYLFSMIVGQFRNIIAPGRAGVHPFAAQKARQAGKHFDSTNLKNIYRSLQQLEMDSKKGKQDMAEGLYKFVFQL